MKISEAGKRDRLGLGPKLFLVITEQQAREINYISVFFYP